jgi:hypothetical protein
MRPQRWRLLRRDRRSACVVWVACMHHLTLIYAIVCGCAIIGMRYCEHPHIHTICTFTICIRIYTCNMNDTFTFIRTPFELNAMHFASVEFTSV